MEQVRCKRRREFSGTADCRLPRSERDGQDRRYYAPKIRPRKKEETPANGSSKRFLLVKFLKENRAGAENARRPPRRNHDATLVWVDVSNLSHIERVRTSGMALNARHYGVSLGS